MTSPSAEDDDTTVIVTRVPGGVTYQGGMGGWITFVPDPEPDGGAE